MGLLKAFSRRQKKSGQHVIDSRRRKEKPSLSTAYSLLSTDNGIALVIAMIISLAVMLLIISTLYFLIQSTGISGAGKRYTTASEAADGAVEVMKDAINLILRGEPVSSLPIVDSNPACLVDSILNENARCTTTLKMPGEDLFSAYEARITVMRLYSLVPPGSSIEFAGSAKNTAVYYRINSVVTGPGNTRAETTVLYRYVH